VLDNKIKGDLVNWDKMRKMAKGINEIIVCTARYPFRPSEVIQRFIKKGEVWDAEAARYAVATLREEIGDKMKIRKLHTTRR